jgi:nitrite reductase (NAD(P)H)
MGNIQTESDLTLDPEPVVPGAPKDRRRIVIVGFGMVATAFAEKILKLDPTCSITVIGEEPHLAYNRVGLTSFFEHRRIEELYLNPKEWVCISRESNFLMPLTFAQYEAQPQLHHQVSTRVQQIIPETKEVITSTGARIPYDILVLCTGSNAVVPQDTPGHDAKEGVFVYRKHEDLERLITFATERVKGSIGLVVGGGLLGLEAAKAMMDLNEFGSVKLVDKNPWVLSRQLDRDAGLLVIDKVEELGLEVMKCHRIKAINLDEEKRVKSVTFTDGKELECSSICFAVSLTSLWEKERKEPDTF